MAFLDRIAHANGIDLQQFTPFIIDNKVVGRIPKLNVPTLKKLPTLLFKNDAITISDALHDMPLQERSEAFNDALKSLQQVGTTIMHSKWWNEHYRADTGWGSEPLLYIERAAAKTFGINGYGVHLNGYVRKSNEMFIWIATRAHDKPTSPGKLDQMVAGGLSAELEPQIAMGKEAKEEANFDDALVNKIKPVSYVSYTCDSRFGSRSDNLFIYDIELPADFQPENTDGEVERFDLLPISDVMELVERTDDFKFNCSLVMIDFFIRHGYITPEHPDYEKLCMGLRQKMPIEQKTS